MIPVSVEHHAAHHYDSPILVCHRTCTDREAASSKSTVLRVVLLYSTLVTETTTQATARFSLRSQHSAEVHCAKARLSRLHFVAPVVRIDVCSAPIADQHEARTAFLASVVSYTLQVPKYYLSSA